MSNYAVIMKIHLKRELNNYINPTAEGVGKDKTKWKAKLEKQEKLNGIIYLVVVCTKVVSTPMKT